MAKYRVNKRGVAKARALIDARQYRVRSRWADVHGRHELDELAAAVVAGETDPYAAADELLRTVSG